MESLYNYRYNNWKKLKTLWQKEKLLFGEKRCSLCGLLFFKLFKELNSMWNSGNHGTGKETFKNLLVENNGPIFSKKHCHNRSLDDFLPKLFKLFRYIEKHGRQGGWACFPYVNLIVQKYLPDFKTICHRLSSFKIV